MGPGGRFWCLRSLKGINREARLIVHALIETGWRPSEIANLLPEHVHLDVPVPFISIRPTEDREIKTQSSIGKIALAGVSLEAMKRAPNGFPHYRDCNDLLSRSLVKAFRNRDLFATASRVICSFRHSFEKRLLGGRARLWPALPAHRPCDQPACLRGWRVTDLSAR